MLNLVIIYRNYPEIPDSWIIGLSIIYKSLSGEFIQHLGVGVGLDGRVHFVIDGGIDVIGVPCYPVQPFSLLRRGGVWQLAHRFQIVTGAAVAKALANILPTREPFR